MSQEKTQSSLAEVDPVQKLKKQYLYTPDDPVQKF